MFIEQIYTKCLAQASYYIESDSIAAVIDPIRDTEVYINLAKERHANINYVFLTHFHADFISGHLDLSDKTGAFIVFGPSAKPKYKAMITRDEDIFQLGKIKIKVLHTPGHTIESSCFLLLDEKEKPYSVFTGDTLFAGDVGRPDLMSGNLGKEKLASMLYDSINNKIKPLPNEVIVYPGHGAGSACGKNLGKELQSTIGRQKKINYALKKMAREKFIHSVTTNQPLAPPYFFKDAQININGYKLLDAVLRKNLKALSVIEFKKEMEQGALVLDTRTSSLFGSVFIKSSIHIGLDGQFANWAGTLIDFNHPLLLVTAGGTEKEVVIRLARIGFEDVKGYLNGGIISWMTAHGTTDNIRTIAMREIENKLSGEPYIMLDVRRHDEVEKEKINGALNIPLDELKSRIKKLDKNKKYVIFCASGYRSMIAVSVMKRNGFNNLINLKGGINIL